MCSVLASFTCTIMKIWDDHTITCVLSLTTCSGRPLVRWKHLCFLTSHLVLRCFVAPPTAAAFAVLSADWYFVHTDASWLMIRLQRCVRCQLCVNWVNGEVTLGECVSEKPEWKPTFFSDKIWLIYFFVAMEFIIIQQKISPLSLFDNNRSIIFFLSCKISKLMTT